MDAASESILLTFKSDRTKGIQLLFDRYYRPLVLFANEMLKDMPLAEDTVQELFVRLWESDNQLNIAPAALSSYLYRSVYNASTTISQKQHIVCNQEHLTDPDVPIEVFSSIEEEKLDLLLKEVSRLSPRSRQAVECVMLRGMKYKEAASELNVSVNTVKFLLKEGIRNLREKVNLQAKYILFFILNKRSF